MYAYSVSGIILCCDRKYFQRGNDRVINSEHHVMLVLIVVMLMKLAISQLKHAKIIRKSLLCWFYENFCISFADIMSSNKSIIMQILSQIRIGMDLTRFALPVFFLEKRSLLQMYADFFTHPDMLAR